MASSKVKNLISPLRYPGAKRWLSTYISNIIKTNNYSIDCFIEPFAGGANVSLSLLSSRMVKKIGLIEIDPLLASFWHTVFYNTQWLIGQIEAAQVNVATWEKIKRWSPNSVRDIGFKCLYLNRTNFSGILKNNTGPIGGRSQNSKYKIDCRFNKKTIIRRIGSIAKFRNQVAFVWNLDWKSAINGILYYQKLNTIGKSLFFYLDPPFYRKGKSVYRYYFDQIKHVELRNYLLMLNQPWILSYDFCPEIVSLYKNIGYHASNVDLKYTTYVNQNHYHGKEIIISNKNDNVGMKLGIDKYISESKKLDSDFHILRNNCHNRCFDSDLKIRNII